MRAGRKAILQNLFVINKYLLSIPSGVLLVLHSHDLIDFEGNDNLTQAFNPVYHIEQSK